jgi:ribonuclease P protein subunit RPR2
MKNVSLIKKVALGRIRMLLALAEAKTIENTQESRRLAKRYVTLARNMSSRYKISIPKELKNKVCTNCGNFLVPGIDCSVRVASVHGYVAYVCECGKERHVFYKNPGKG